MPYAVAGYQDPAPYSNQDSGDQIKSYGEGTKQRMNLRELSQRLYLISRYSLFLKLCVRSPIAYYAEIKNTRWFACAYAVQAAVATTSCSPKGRVHPLPNDYKPDSSANRVRIVLVYTSYPALRVSADLPCGDMGQRFEAECGSQLFRAKVQAGSAEHCCPHC